MAGQYWKVLDDGVAFRCRECQELKPYTRVVLMQHTETKERKLLCLDCIDEEWMAEAICLGDTDDLEKELRLQK